MNYDHLKCFCGRHELMLNNLKSRWYLRDIVNFLDFFKEPWVELILHDKFEELTTLNKVLVTRTAEDVLKEVRKHFCKEKKKQQIVNLFYTPDRISVVI